MNRLPQLQGDFEMNREFLLSALNSVASNIAIIDQNGIIVAVNQPWLTFAAENGYSASDIGTNYLTVCKKGDTSEGANLAYNGICDVLAGRLSRFFLEYPCHSKHQQRWFEMNVTPMDLGVQYGAIIAHNNITERHLMQTELKRLAAYRETESQKLANALEKLRQLTASSELLLVEERKRIAYELHDELGQLLAALRLDIGMLKMEHSTQVPELATKTTQMQSILDKALSSMYGIVANLRPTILDMGLVAALEWLNDDFSRMFNIPCHLNSHGDAPEISDAQLTLIFRITQELLTNAVRHADASLIKTNIIIKNNLLHLSVQDNGIGFDPTTAQHKSQCFGLFGMQERMLALGGKLLIDTAHGMGSCVTLQIPLSKESG
jgi:PAS domain S-box-containing protein